MKLLVAYGHTATSNYLVELYWVAYSAVGVHWIISHYCDSNGRRHVYDHCYCSKEVAQTVFERQVVKVVRPQEDGQYYLPLEHKLEIAM